MLGLFVFGSMVTLLLTDTTKAVRQSGEMQSHISIFFVIILNQLIEGRIAADTWTRLSVQYTVGRLRPHFLAVCRPALQPELCGTPEHPLYVTNYTCRGDPGPDRQHQLAQAGHSHIIHHVLSSCFQVSHCTLRSLQPAM